VPDPDPASRLEDADLAEDTTSGDLVAVEFEPFYRATALVLVRFLVLQGARPADAADIAHDTLCSAYARWLTLTHPRAWCFTVASRAWIRHAIHHRPEELTEDPSPPSPLLAVAPTDAWHIRHDVVTALALLPPRQRQVMAWTLSGYTPAEIATELHLSHSAVRANLRLARHTLTQHLTTGEA
jgi:RNA polymerase sigma factor (sigma-70 family)